MIVRQRTESIRLVDVFNTKLFTYFKNSISNITDNNRYKYTLFFDFSTGLTNQKCIKSVTKGIYFFLP